jgi:nitroreductase
MTVKEAIQKRRAYRSLEKTEIPAESKKILFEAAQLAPSCYNNQPWRFVYIDDEKNLKKMQSAYSKGNEWAYDASLIIAVCSKKELDCIIQDRFFYAFDTGLATGQMLLQAVELGLVAHPIAGFSPDKVREILQIPKDIEILTLVVFGKYKENTEEAARPPRKKLEEFSFCHTFQEDET